MCNNLNPPPKGEVIGDWCTVIISYGKIQWSCKYVVLQIVTLKSLLVFLLEKT